MSCNGPTNVLLWLALSNIAYFNLGSQLAYFTDNQTMSKLAEDTYDLLSDIGFVNDKFDVYDGAHADTCNEINKAQYSHNAAMLLEGFAYQYKYVCLQPIDSATERIFTFEAITR